MEPKDFAVGLRLEHSQQEIDRIQYHTPEGRGKWLPAAEYNFVTNIDGTGSIFLLYVSGWGNRTCGNGADQQVVKDVLLLPEYPLGKFSYGDSYRPGRIGKYELPGIICRHVISGSLGTTGMGGRGRWAFRSCSAVDRLPGRKGQ